AKWTDEIHEEWMRGVLERYPDRTRAEVERVRDLMNAHVRDCLVSNYADLIPTLQLPDPDDRHVLAAAIRTRADVIVTSNLSDFPPDAIARFGIEAQHPDQFITHLLDLDPGLVCAAAKRQRESLKNPPKTVAEFLQTLEAAGLAQTVAGLREFAELI
ncbi:MAG TPA: PIN domain-containing protein, partial [Planctomycetaceae bacterium]|nr:PIN domain-containing protein [Planctomycetaceae bacterium]